MEKKHIKKHNPQNHKHNHKEVNGANLLISLLLNAGVTAVEFFGALISGSLALMSDAVHNLGDTFSILIAYLASRLSKKKADRFKTFGYRRIEILAALFNSLILVGISGFLISEGIERIANPRVINTSVMLGIAFIGLFVNTASALLLHKDKSKSLNIKASYIHLVSDAFSSLAVIVGSVIIADTKLYLIDSIIAFVIAGFILYNVFSIISNAVSILLQSTPKGFDIDEIKDELEKVEGVSNIHHLHVWSLDDNHKYFECHVCLNNDLKISETATIRHKMKEKISSRFGFTHITLQIEYNECNGEGIIANE